MLLLFFKLFLQVLNGSVVVGGWCLKLREATAVMLLLTRCCFIFSFAASMQKFVRISSHFTSWQHKLEGSVSNPRLSTPIWDIKAALITFSLVLLSSIWNYRDQESAPLFTSYLSLSRCAQVFVDDTECYCEFVSLVNSVLDSKLPSRLQVIRALG